MITLQLYALVCLLVCTGGERECVAEEVAKENEKSNIIFILFDDVGWAYITNNTPSQDCTLTLDSLAGQWLV